MTAPTAAPQANAANILKWVLALEAPDAPEQCIELSHDGDKRCAIGVCHDIIESDPTARAHYASVDRWLGLPFGIVRIIMREWNDRDRLSFRQIAAKIREWCKENGIELSTEATHAD